ncbi:MAG: hypothetical protein HOH74_07595 [Gemmatimonadetes bacterium]|jgi:catechol 2,3-dioxygenase-like lactoylglutathione lyase family enzyme|nr:hypothetical protein [Gemmatimonadota bacterium]
MRLNGICLVSDDIRRLRAFYIQLLQIQPSGDEDWWVDFGMVGDAQLVLYSEAGMEQMAPGSMVGSGNGRFTLELEVDDPDAECQRMTSFGVEVVKPPTTQTWGRRSVWLRDPAGNIVNLYTNVASGQDS